MGLAFLFPSLCAAFVGALCMGASNPSVPSLWYCKGSLSTSKCKVVFALQVGSRDGSVMTLLVTLEGDTMPMLLPEPVSLNTVALVIDHTAHDSHASGWFSPGPYSFQLAGDTCVGARSADPGSPPQGHASPHPSGWWVCNPPYS